MLSLLPQLLDYQIYGPTILRFALGAVLVAHGYKKLVGDKSGFASYLESLKFWPGKFWAWLVTLVEFVGGILLILGLWMQLAALVLAVQFLVIVFYVQRGKSFMGGWEFDFLIFMSLLALLILGPGALSLDLPL